MTGWQVLGTSVLTAFMLGIFGMATSVIYDDGGWSLVAKVWGLVAGVLAFAGFLLLMIALATGTLP